MIYQLVQDLNLRLGRRFWTVLSLAGLTAMLEGMSAALLIPLFRQLGIGNDEASGLPLEAVLAEFLGLFGVELTLGSVTAVFFVFVAMQSTIFLAFQWLSSRLQSDYIASLARSVVTLCLNAQWPMIATRQRGELVNTLSTDILNRVGLAVTNVINIAGISAFIVVYLTLAFLLAWKAAALLVGLGFILVLAMRPIGHRGEQVGRALQESDGSLVATVSEYVSSLKTIKILNAEREAVRKTSDAVEKRTGPYFWYLFYPGMARSMIEFMAPVILAVTLIAGTRLLELGTATILVVVGIFARLYPRISTLQQNWQSLRMLAPGAASVFGLERELASGQEDLSDGSPREGKTETAKPPAISFRQVSVNYGNRSALRDISFEIGAGEVVAIIGPSGGGKTTIIDALLGLVPLTSGEILIDGQSLKEIPLLFWRRSTAYVAQDNVLFRGNIADNIRAGSPHLSDDAVLEAARQADVDSFVAALQTGYRTGITEGGGGLSGGQAQRIAIARALARKSPLLVIDEGTSALDSEAEAKVMRSILGLRRKTTIVLIAHRFSTIKSADKIVLVEQGGVVGGGTWDELYRESELFRDLLERQAI